MAKVESQRSAARERVASAEAARRAVAADFKAAVLATTGHEDLMASAEAWTAQLQAVDREAQAAADELARREANHDKVAAAMAESEETARRRAAAEEARLAMEAARQRHEEAVAAAEAAEADEANAREALVEELRRQLDGSEEEETDHE